MGNNQDGMNRRNFLKSVGVAGMGSLLGSAKGASAQAAEQKDKGAKYPQVATRTLGKTGVQVPIISHGLMHDLVDNQLVLRKALQWGVSHWDTANMYANGNSELGVGKFLKRSPLQRKNLFIVTKASYANSVREVEERLQTSLKRMNTDYIDLFYGVHALSDPDGLTRELRDWAQEAKARGLIRYFGFSTHKNMTECLQAASQLDWIDAVMTSYNFRLMQDKKLNRAIDACHKAGVGLIAMKTQGKTIRSSQDRKLTEHFLRSGYTEGQAKLKAVLDDKRFAAVCVTMQNVALLTTNVAAALDRTTLSKADKKYMELYAAKTCGGYCAGCSTLCSADAPEFRHISDVMRYLMYSNSYGDKEKAQRLFGQIPGADRRKLASADFSKAESICPQKLPIGKLVQEAVSQLS